MGVLAEVESIWKGRSSAVDQWYKKAIAPAVEQALATLVREQISQARDVELRRLARGPGAQVATEAKDVVESFAKRDGAVPESETTNDGCSLDFLSETGRSNAIAAYITHWTTDSWTCSEAALARTARVDPADLSRWKKGLLPADSEKKSRVEKALKDTDPPTPPAGRQPKN